MDCNDILKKIRYAFNFRDKVMVEIFKEAGYEITEAEVINMLRKQSEETYKECKENELIFFLNGLIIKNRGRKEEKEDAPKKEIEVLTNNVIMKKLKIALDFKSDDMIEMLKLSGVIISPPELSAIFRNSNHRNYKECGDRYVRNFLRGLGIKLRGK